MRGIPFMNFQICIPNMDLYLTLSCIWISDPKYIFDERMVCMSSCSAIWFILINFQSNWTCYRVCVCIRFHNTHQSCRAVQGRYYNWWTGFVDFAQTSPSYNSWPILNGHFNNSLRITLFLILGLCMSVCTWTGQWKKKRNISWFLIPIPYI